MQQSLQSSILQQKKKNESVMIGSGDVGDDDVENRNGIHVDSNDDDLHVPTSPTSALIRPRT